jgi:hypothetical protein
MIHSNQWLQHVAGRLAANGFAALAPEKYQSAGFKYAARRSRFELSKFGVAEYFFTFAEIPNLTPDVLRQFSGAAFQFANHNKTASLPNGFFMATFCFAVAITANIHPQTAQFIRDSAPVKHWSAFELPVAFDLMNGGLYYFEKTPVWGAAYYKGFRREIQANLG